MNRRPDPVAVRARALAPLVQVSAAAGSALALLAAFAPRWCGDGRAALLAGVPAALLIVLAIAGGAFERRRVCMVLATTVAGGLALATSGSLGGLEHLDGPRQAAVHYQIGCLVIAALVLARAVPCWRRVEAEGRAADDLLAMYEEL